MSNNGLLTLLTPENCALILIDHQPQMFFGVGSTDRGALMSNVVALAKSAKVFKVPTILTTVAAKTFSGSLMPDLQAVFPDTQPIDRTTMNSWENQNLRKAVEATGRKKLVMAALWSEVCLAFPAIEAVRDGYEVYAVTDASGGTTKEAHDMAIQRMLQVGVAPVTWLQFLLELQRDWARTGTYNAVGEVVTAHAGAYGLGMRYAKEFIGAHASEAGAALAAH